jgi:hypothetical protein
MKFEQLAVAVTSWAKERGIYEHSTATAQLLKAVSEMGELCDAEAKKDLRAQIDAIGDVMVCLINYSTMHQLDIVSCLEAAYDEIKDRKGRMIAGGVFIKEEQ